MVDFGNQVRRFDEVKQLRAEDDEDVNTWAVKAQRTLRTSRYKDLKQKGLC